MDGRSRSDHPGIDGTARLSGIFLLLLVLLWAGVEPLAAQDRLTRSFDARDGLAAPTVFSLAQDSTGFLWIGTVGGLYRYDGVEMRPWAPATIQGRVRRITVPGPGRLAALEETGELWWIEASGARPIVGSTGTALTDVLDVARGGDGTLWILREGEGLWRREEGGWREAAREALADEEPRRIFPGPGGGVDLATETGLWHVPPDGPPRRLTSLPRIVDVLSVPGGRRYVLTFWREAYALEDGDLRRVADVPGRGIDLVRRGDVVWASYDRFLARLAPGRETLVLGPRNGLQDGGPLLVDHEGSLWMGTYSGVRQFPEPETYRWADGHGLPSAHTRFLARAGDTVWVTTWQGAGRVERRGSGWVADTADGGWVTRSQVVVDDEGDAWLGTDRGLLQLRSGRPPSVEDRSVRGVYSVSRDRDDELWMGVRGRVLRVRTAGYEGNGRDAPAPVRGLDVPEDAPVTALLRDTGDRLWAGVGERICRTGAEAVRAGGDADWRCWTFPDAVHFNALHETTSGSVWAASPYAGILRWRGGRWDTLPGVSELASRSVLNLVPSTEGGVWMLGHGILLRVRPDPAADGGWTVLERLSPWHGLPTTGGRDLLEMDDGTLWVTTSRGLVRIPGRVRRASPSPPGVALVEARVDDERLPLDDPPDLPHDRNRLELRFAALSFRAPTALRYQVRLLPGSGWSDAGSQPVVRWVDLRPGDYRVQVRASLDGESWSEPSATFAFTVLPPWYLEPRWLAVFALAILLAGLLAYRTRVAHLVGLERQRTRIAMDLHDEMGAALGSIGIQAGMLTGPDVDDSKRRRLASRIAETSGDLGATLADIVWSLDLRASTLDDLAVRLEDRGRQLFSADGADLDVRLPESHTTEELPASVRRNVLMIGLEALNNAAVHADADTVRLSLEPARRGIWRLTVRDDGAGFSADDAREGNGMGLLSMRRRAGEIAAEIAWRRPARGGTEVELTFPLGGRRPWKDRLVTAWRRLRDRMDVLLRRG